MSENRRIRRTEKNEYEYLKESADRKSANTGSKESAKKKTGFAAPLMGKSPTAEELYGRQQIGKSGHRKAHATAHHSSPGETGSRSETGRRADESAEHGFYMSQPEKKDLSSGLYMSSGEDHQTEPVNIREKGIQGELVLVVMDGAERPKNYRLGQFQKQEIVIGRPDRENPLPIDIPLSSPFVSRNDHCRIRKENGRWVIRDSGGVNGILCNGTLIKARILQNGDTIRIGKEKGLTAEGVLILAVVEDDLSAWRSLPIRETPIRIGRDADNDLTLQHIGVSRHHAEIARIQGTVCIRDLGSTNGVYVNGHRIGSNAVPLHEKDVIFITWSRMIYSGGELFFHKPVNGISVEADDVVIRRKHGLKSFVTSDHVNLNIHPGELVCIIGGSGAGKSTILNAMCGYLRPATGCVRINSMDLYQNFDLLKTIIGYVPQQDIVYDTLSLYDTLRYTAQLRLPEDVTEEEREKAIDNAISMVELQDKKNALIGNLSGGQRKRASIAVELLSDPGLLFLDEPCSGLDPGTERSLMETLRRMADKGKTIILVTHSTLQLKLCDRIVFMGRGGRLCFFGSYHDALHFFKVSNIVDCYEIMNNESEKWQGIFRKYQSEHEDRVNSSEQITPPKRKSRRGQLGVLIARYLRLTVNDRSRWLLLLLLVPIVVILISLVKNGDEFQVDGGLNITRNLMFVLSCSCFFLGMFGSISEISKERTIVRREYMTGLSLWSYTVSKLVVLGLICLIQSLLITVLFGLMVGHPDPGERLLMPPLIEMGITTFLLEMASAAMGLLVSALVPKPDLGVTITVVLLMPQILFSGLTFDLHGMTDIISWFTVCRWGMEGFGSSADLNRMSYRLTFQGQEFLEKNIKDMFEATGEHLLMVWGILLGYVVICTVLTGLAMNRIRHD